MFLIHSFEIFNLLFKMTDMVKRVTRLQRVECSFMVKVFFNNNETEKSEQCKCRRNIKIVQGT